MRKTAERWPDGGPGHRFYVLLMVIQPRVMQGVGEAVPA